MRLRSSLRNAAAYAFSHVPGNGKFTSAVLAGHVVKRFIDGDAGQQYGLTRADRRRLVGQFQRINQNVPSATLWPTYIVMAERLLSVPRQVDGHAIECGCYKGASTAALSLVCRIAGRKLIACDSFEGLPEDRAGARHSYPHLRVTTTYRQGELIGRLDEVQANIRRYGAFDVCEFRKGFFSDTLSGFSDPLVFGFLDVDLVHSMEDCVRHLWPQFKDDSYVFTDDSCDMEVVRVWFDAPLWAELGLHPPGYVGSGCGIPSISPDYSSLGYTIKNPAAFRSHDFMPA